MHNDNLNQDIPNFEPQTPQDEQKESFKSFLYETLKIVIIALVIVIPIRHYVIQPFYVKGNSMEPNYHDKEYLIVNEISYRFGQPQRGDVVVLQPPGNGQDFYIKRVIGLPGEKVTIDNCQVKIYNANHPAGMVLDEGHYLAPNTQTCADVDIELKGQEYFVMGDNRDSSLDSRSFGAVNKESIVGKTWLRVLPFDKFTVFDGTQYQF